MTTDKITTTDKNGKTAKSAKRKPKRKTAAPKRTAEDTRGELLAEMIRLGTFLDTADDLGLNSTWCEVHPEFAAVALAYVRTFKHGN